jgi:hypothetical protein
MLQYNTGIGCPIMDLYLGYEVKSTCASLVKKGKKREVQNKKSQSMALNKSVKKIERN